eukprot:TRINITY_DN412_c0_g2_i1.p1 TRINITY_DN412_c0_g2~~TRINITY_DN412_c0_g2_i1.p1  ORF type:complete len:389 (+),score=147.55 TRINITY_DN412_c0_g2_i1:97-1167(+)
MAAAADGPAARKRCVVTGGCGFIGHHLVIKLVQETDYEVVVLDKLTYASFGDERLRDAGVLDKVTLVKADLCQPFSEEDLALLRPDEIDVIVHMAAETHVDNSISDPVPVVQNNINSTLFLLEFARRLPRLSCFLYFSTDEVYGPAEPDVEGFLEWDRHRPSNPYSASKSAAEQLCYCYYNTYKLPLISMNVMNAYGERQHPEKFIPLCIKKVMEGETVTLHCHPGTKRPGSRFYIHAKYIASAVLYLVEHGKKGEKYNVRGEKEMDNLELAQFIAEVVGKPLKYQLDDDVKIRPGHDTRYALDGAKMREMGWSIPGNFHDTLRATIEFTVKHKRWLSGDVYEPTPTQSPLTPTPQ